MDLDEFLNENGVIEEQEPVRNRVHHHPLPPANLHNGIRPQVPTSVHGVSPPIPTSMQNGVPPGLQNHSPNGIQNRNPNGIQNRNPNSIQNRNLNSIQNRNPNGIQNAVPTSMNGLSSTVPPTSMPSLVRESSLSPHLTPPASPPHCVTQKAESPLSCSSKYYLY